jgi:dolichol-phosphate mannosyltransferase
MYDLTIIIPTFNEAKSIRKTITRVDEACRVAHINEEILIVDDDSNDGTQDIMRDLAAIYPNVHLLIRVKDRGLSKSLADGFTYASSEIIMVMDSDGQHPPDKIKKLYDLVNNREFDISIASRYIEGGGVGEIPLYRKILSWGATYLARFFFPDITDSGSGFFALRKKVIMGAPLEPRGFRMLFEILGKGYWSRAKEIPYTLETRQDGMSKLKASTIVDYLKQLWNLFTYSVTNKNSKGHAEIKRVITFAIIGLSGIVVNIGLLYWLTEYQHWWYLYSFIVGIEASIVTNFILNDYITFSDVTTKNDMLTRFITYNIVCLGGIGIMTATTVFLVEIMHVWYIAGSMVGILLAFAWNFGLSRGSAWSKK